MRVPFGRSCLLLLALTAGGCNGGAKPLFTAGDDPAVILDRAIEAQGGARYLQRWKVGTARYRYSTSSGEYLVEDHFQLPRSSRRTTRPLKSEADAVTVVVDGEQS